MSVFLDWGKIQAGSRLRQQRVHLGPSWGDAAAAEAGAFEAGGRGGEPERVLDTAALDQGKNERAVKHIAGAIGIGGADSKTIDIGQSARWPGGSRPKKSRGSR